MPLSLNTHSHSPVSHAGGTSSITGELAPRTLPKTVDAFERGSGRRASNPWSHGPTPPSELRVPAQKPVNRIPNLSPATTQKLLDLSDTSTLEGVEDFAARVEEISRLFIQAQDPRGAFPALYKVITHHAHASVKQGIYGDNQWAKDLVIDFGELYLKNLHAHLQGRPTSAGWQRYYDLAADPGVSLERLVAIGATVHLVVDLPKSLARLETPAERRDDFMHFGDTLLEGYEEMLEAAWTGHGIDMSEIFGLFALGEIADEHHGEGTATRFGFQTIRRKAWLQGQLLQDSRSPFAQAEIAISWRTIDGILAGLDAGNLL